MPRVRPSSATIPARQVPRSSTPLMRQIQRKIEVVREVTMSSREWCDHYFGAAHYS